MSIALLLSEIWSFENLAYNAHSRLPKLRFGGFDPKHYFSSSTPQKGTSWRETASYEISCVKIGSAIFLVGDDKNKKGKGRKGNERHEKSQSLTGKPKQQWFTIGSGTLTSTSSRWCIAISGCPLPEQAGFGPTVAARQTHLCPNQPH